MYEKNILFVIDTSFNILILIGYEMWLVCSVCMEILRFVLQV
jgi:hypothetical protein